jgi:hypothetical protein
MDVKLFVILLAVLTAGCSIAGHVVPQHSGSPHALFARIVLPARTVIAGSSINGRVVVRNNTGRAVHPVGCLYLFAVALTSSTYHPDVGGPACWHRFTIPAGVSSYPVSVSATYLSCGQRGSPGTTHVCLPGGRMPPLPAGKYRAKLFPLGPRVQAPPGVPVRVIPRM